jgi:hypothetical protein
MAIIVISMWVTCVSRAYHFRHVVESYEGLRLIFVFPNHFLLTGIASRV